jgi:uncharacterized protein
MTTFDLRSLSLRSGEQQLETLDVELEPLRLGGQEYRPEPDPVPARLTVSRASSGTFFELAFDLTLRGPCFRCLEEAAQSLSLRVREYQAADPGDDDELRTEYLADDRLDVSGWARDAVVLALPDKILCLPECAGLCPVCGRNLNDEPHEHAEVQGDPRWAALQSLRDAE